MKKLIAIFVALVMVLFSVAALAETKSRSTARAKSVSAQIPPLSLWV